MKTLMIAAAALLSVVPATAQQRPPIDGPIEREVTYYPDGDPSEQNPVGKAYFYCNGQIETYGLVTSNEREIYYGCPA